MLKMELFPKNTVTEAYVLNESSSSQFKITFYKGVERRGHHMNAAIPRTVRQGSWLYLLYAGKTAF
jgi:hypothetical protein